MVELVACTVTLAIAVVSLGLRFYAREEGQKTQHERWADAFYEGIHCWLRERSERKLNRRAFLRFVQATQTDVLSMVSAYIDDEPDRIRDTTFVVAYQLVQKLPPLAMIHHERVLSQLPYLWHTYWCPWKERGTLDDRTMQAIERVREMFCGNE